VKYSVTHVGPDQYGIAAVRVADLPGKLLPGMQLFPPLVSQSLGGAPGGLETGVAQIGTVPFSHLAAVSVCTVRAHGADVPLVLLFVGGQRRPVAVEATKIRARELGIEGPPHRPENLRKLILHLAREAPHLVVDSATLEFLRGRMLLSRGDRLSDLADAVGMILVRGEGIREVEAGAPSPPAPLPEGEGSRSPGIELPSPSGRGAGGEGRLWVHPENRVLVAFSPGKVFLSGSNAAEVAALAGPIGAGADPCEVLAGRAAEIPSAAVTHVRMNRGAQVIELEYRSRDGARKAAVPYGREDAGRELFEALRRHLGSGRPAE
jgi:hypothetical protein